MDEERHRIKHRQSHSFIHPGIKALFHAYTSAFFRRLSLSFSQNHAMPCKPSHRVASLVYPASGGPTTYLTYMQILCVMIIYQITPSKPFLLCITERP